MMEWIYSPITDTNYIIDERLKNKRCSILITYKTRNGRRYVKQVECSNGRVSKKVGGQIIAWMPLPEAAKWG